MNIRDADVDLNWDDPKLLASHRDYVSRVIRALGERGILERIQGVLMGMPYGGMVRISPADKSIFAQI